MRGLSGILGLVCLSWLGAQEPELAIDGLLVSESRLGPPLDSLAVSPGEVLFFRFDLAGVRRDYRNHIAVQLGLRLLDPDGRELFAAPGVVQRRGLEPFAAELLPCALSFQVAEPRLGPHQIVLRAFDQLADQVVEETVAVRLREPGLRAANLRLCSDARGSYERTPVFQRGESFFLCARLLGLAKGARVRESVELVELLPSGTELSRGIIREQSLELEELDGFAPYRLRVPCTRAGDFRLLVRLSETGGPELSFEQEFSIQP